MAALTAASWTVSITEQRIMNRKREVEGTLLLAATDTYPDNGIPLPAIGALGFVRNMAGLILYGVDATAGTVSDFMTKYDKVNHKLFVYEEEGTAAGGPLLEAGAAVAPGARTWNFLAWGW